jgi:hypothetical protein
VADLSLTKGTLTVSYEESAFQSVSLRPEQHSVVRHVQVSGADEVNAGQAFLGWSEYDATAGTIHRYSPESHPRYLSCVARTWDFIQPTGEPRQDPLWDNCNVFGRVEYAVGYEHSLGVNYYPDSSRPEGVLHDAWRYVQRRQDFETSSLPVPRNLLYFFQGPDGVADRKVPDPGTVMVFESTWYATWLQVPLVQSEGRWFLPGSLPLNITATVLRMNSVEWDGWPPESLLCLAPKIEIVPMSNQQLAANITYPMLVRGGLDVSGPAYDNVGTITPSWTRLIRGDGRYWRVYAANPADATDKTRRLYAAADYQWLFRVDTPPFVISH